MPPSTKAAQQSEKGAVLFRQGEFAKAARAFEAAVKLEPNNPERLYYLAVAEYKAGRLEASLRQMERLIRLSPDLAQAHSVKGAVLNAQGRSEEAIAAYRRAITLNPALAEAHSNLGNALHKLGRDDEAMDAFRQALAVNPSYAMAYSNLAALLAKQGQSTEAFELYRQAASLAPNNPSFHLSIGAVLRKLGRMEEAITAYRNAIALDPKRYEAYGNLGNALADLGRYEEAIAAYRQALVLNPNDRQSKWQLAHRLRYVCQWGEVEVMEAELLAAPHQDDAPFDPLPALAFEAASGADLLRLAKDWGRQYGANTPFTHAPRPKDGRRLRVGYLSVDLRQHPVAALMAELLEVHDRQHFEIHAYSYGPDDGSPLRRRMEAAVEHFTDIRAQSFAQEAQRIHDDGIDILVDLTGYTSQSRPEILGLRPAPLQVNFLGYPGSMGAPFIDYIIGDGVVTPIEHQHLFSEKIVQLPLTYQPNDGKRVFSPGQPSRAEQGLPESGIVFCSFNNSFKLTASMFAAWMRILRAVPGSVLWLLAGTETARRNLLAAAQRQGIGPERIVFAGRLSPEEHLSRFRLADIFLDSTPYNAHTTASDALWCGVPVVTMMGESFQSRVAASLLRAAGLQGLSTTSLPEYEAAAIALAQDPARLKSTKNQLGVGNLALPLFDAKLFAQGLEDAYRRMAEIWAEGKTPETIVVIP